MSSGKGKGKRSKPRDSNTDLNGGDAKRSKNGCEKNGDNDVVLKLSPFLTEDSSLEKLSASWENRTAFALAGSDKTESCAINPSPFPFCVTNGFVQSEEAIQSLTEELGDLDYNEKSNDLYKFHQSGDLNHMKTPALKSFQRFMQTDVRSFLTRTTGIQFHDTIDMFAARYDYTDYLMCHDDELEGRRIAYIWYLVPPTWEKNDGGALELFSVDTDHNPVKVEKSLVPKRNSFVFFEVSAKSYHQVAEVLSKDETRLTIGGWFHAETLPRPPKAPLPPLETSSPEDISEEDFFTWINPMYFDPFTQLKIKKTFAANSEISLPGFLVDERYAAVSEALKESGLDWKSVGPPTKRNYETLAEDVMPDAVKHCQRLFKSDAMFLLLSAMTGLRLHEMAEEESSGDEEESDEDDDEEGEAESEEETLEKGGENKEDECEEEEEPAKKKSKTKDDSPVAGSSSQDPDDEEKAPKKEPKPINPRCSTEVRRWTSGSYTMISDDDGASKAFALDARLFFNCKDWSLDMGGYSSYIARDEDEELLTAQPEENALVLVYRDKETLQFVKRVTDEVEKVADGELHDVSVVYYER